MMSLFKLFLILYYIKQIDSKLPCVCSVIDHRGYQNVVRTSVTHWAALRVPLFSSYHILASVLYYWTDARQLGVYLLIGTQINMSVGYWKGGNTSEFTKLQSCHWAQEDLAEPKPLMKYFPQVTLQFRLLNPLHPNISLQVLHSVLYTFPMVLRRRIWLTIKSFLGFNHFLYSHDHNVWLKAGIVGRNLMLITLRG